MWQSLRLTLGGIAVFFLSSSSAQNIITNGNFSDGFSGWGYATYESAVATFVVNNGEALVQISYGGTGIWNVQLWHGNFGLQANHRYTLSFAARASSDRTINIGIDQNYSPFNDYAGLEAIPITTTMTTYTRTFIMSADEPSARIAFNLGGQSPIVTIDDVSLVDNGPAYSVIMNVRPAGSGTTTPSPSFSAFTGDVRALTCSPVAGYHFERWSSQSGNVVFSSVQGLSTNATLNITANETIFATFLCDDPRFIRQPVQDTSVGVGRSVTLSVQAAGCPSRALTYQWYRKGVSIDGEVASSLVINSVTKADSGVYHCIVSDGTVSLTSQNALLRVLSLPVITQQPSDRMTNAAGNVTFSVTADGDALAYQWYRSGSQLSGKTDRELALTGITPDDDGATFHVTVTNPVGTVTSRVCTLSVGTFYNPFYVRFTQPDPRKPTRITLTVSSSMDLSKVQISDNPLVPWTDSVWIGYRTHEYPASTTQSGLGTLSIPVRTIRDAPSQTYQTTIDVPSLPVDHDSLYYFSHTALWHYYNNVAVRIDTMLALVQDSALFMFDTVSPYNGVVISGTQVGISDSLRLTLSGLSFLTTYDSTISIRISRSRDVSAAFLEQSIAVKSLDGLSDKAEVYVRSTQFVGERTSIHFGWQVVGFNGRVSTLKTDSCVVGFERPVYSGGLWADSTLRGDQLKIWWNTPGYRTDSARVWWTRAPDTISLGHQISLPVSQAFAVTVTDTVDTVTGLASETDFNLGIQFKRDGLWSAITAAARTSMRTAQSDTIVVANTISIDTAWFDPVANSIRLIWHANAPALAPGVSLEWGSSLSPDRQSYAATQPSTWTSVTTDSNAIMVPIGKNINFDTIYTVGLWLRGTSDIKGPGSPAGPGDSVRYTVTIPDFTWQEVSYFPEELGDSVFANNRRFVMVRNINAGTNNLDIMRRYDPPASMLEGMVFISYGFKFDTGNRNAPIQIGIRFGNLPSGISESQLRMYRDSAGTPFLDNSSFITGNTVWVRTSDLAQPFIIMADTARPRLSFDPAVTDTQAILPANTEVPYTFTARDNIGNLQVQLLYGRGNSVLNGSQRDTLKSRNRTIAWKIPASYVSTFYGLRAYVVLNDGVNRDTIDVSRQVRCQDVDQIPNPGNRWVPVRATAVMDDPSLSSALKSVLAKPDAGWHYADSLFRVFRYLPHADTSSWQEFTTETADQFSLVPGRLIWVKTKESPLIKLENGVTQSLKDDMVITLPPQRWTDIALPYKFKVRLADIAMKTGPVFDSLMLCQWVHSDTGKYSYIAQERYLPGFSDALDSLRFGAMIYEPLNDGYTIFNNTTRSVSLRLPPLPPELTRADKWLETRPLKKVAHRESWTLAVHWSETGSGTGRSMRIGYLATGDEGPEYLPLAPSFSRSGAALVDPSTNRRYGHMVLRSLQNGGAVCPIQFYNHEPQACSFSFGLQSDVDVPAERTVLVVDENGDAATTPLTLEPGASATRYVVLGSAEYVSEFSKRLAGLKPGILGIYPNPCAVLSRLSVRFVLPAAQTAEVRFQMYDLNGRLVRSMALREGLRAGINDCRLPVYDLNHLSTGIYLLQFTARLTDGSVIALGRQRLTLVR